MKKVVLSIALGLILTGMTLVALAQAQQVKTTDPNSIADPNAIKLPEDAKMPIRLKCSIHGIIGKAFIVIDTDAGPKVYCSKCAKTFVAEVFDLNLPKLEVLK